MRLIYRLLWGDPHSISPPYRSEQDISGEEEKEIATLVWKICMSKYSDKKY
jgi:hypothetical protein